jgi:hypothetical protein
VEGADDEEDGAQVARIRQGGDQRYGPHGPITAQVTWGEKEPEILGHEVGPEICLARGWADVYGLLYFRNG